MPQHHLLFGWIWITTGFVSGTLIGLFFYDTAWLGGYGSWSRRMLRLGHISLIGTGLLNIAFALSLREISAAEPPYLASWLFVIGALSMPLVCFLSAWRSSLRRLFVIPVASLIVAGVDLIARGLL